MFEVDCAHQASLLHIHSLHAQMDFPKLRYYDEFDGEEPEIWSFLG